MMYFKSVYTGQVYAMDFIPQVDGYELATKEEYEAYCISKFGKII